MARRWRELAEALFAKYNDGYVQDDTSDPKELGYPEPWLREVVKARGRELALPSGGIIKSPASY